MMDEYYSSSTDEVLHILSSSKDGLSQKEAEKLLEEHGHNEIQKTHKISPLRILFRQFTSFIVLILLVAILVSLFIGEFLDAGVIAIIVILNGIFGFVQEFNAEKSIEALRKLTALKAKVIREGKELEVDSRDLVPGDIIVLETGSKIPADARLIEAAQFQADEASLTGESVPTKKLSSVLKSNIPLGDQKNMVFMGTIVTRGHAQAVVTGTGMKTEIGKVATMVQEVGEKMTPLQERLSHLGKWLGIAALFVSLIVFAVGFLRHLLIYGTPPGHFINELFLAAIALAVAAIPEGLPAIVTISLALGVKRMIKRNVLIRNLPAVETLGSTNVICSDKTGTLTRNEMTVRQLYVDGRNITLTGSGYTPQGEFQENGRKIPISESIKFLLRIGTLCNDAKLQKSKKWEIFGDPTEGALIVSATKAGMKVSNLFKKFPRIDELPFDEERKTMTTVHRDKGKTLAYVKGAPDVIIKNCKYIYRNGRAVELTKAEKKHILAQNKEMATDALRILAFAYKPLSKRYKLSPKELERDLIFVGLQGMYDPPRESVKEAITKCHLAGIRTVVITGDYKLTAIAIAKNLGVYKDGDKALNSDELDSLSDKELAKVVDDVVIYARVSPAHKARILSALQKNGNVVAMTGDGVNDAPALKRADIGVAMGISGTDVAKEASDMILTDDNFSSIVNAVEEGRRIYSSIKSFVQYTLSSNLGEILVVFLAILMGWPLPLIAIQILWVNLLTDGLPGLALGLDPFDKNIMKKSPRKRNERIISSEVIWNIAIVGVVMTIGTLGLFYYYGLDNSKARTIAFTTLVVFQLFNVLTYRAHKFMIRASNSRFLIGAVIISVLMQLLVIYTPLNVAFKTVPLGFLDWALIILVSATLYVILELRKMFINRYLPT